MVFPGYFEVKNLNAQSIEYHVGELLEDIHYRLRKQVLDKFPEAFIIAFRNGAKMNVNEAIREFKNNRTK